MLAISHSRMSSSNLLTRLPGFLVKRFEVISSHWTIRPSVIALRIGAKTPTSFSLTRDLTTVSKETPIGLIGCGNVGVTVGQNLHRAGFNVVSAHDLDQSRLLPLPPGITRATTARQVAEQSQVIITSLPRPASVKASAEGTNGILAGLRKGMVWIDHSTTNYEQTLIYNQMAQEKGWHILEAPITGGLEALQKGQMVVFLGGDQAVAQAVKPILDVSYSDSVYVGEIGGAMVVKVISNMLCCVHVIAMGEALMLAKRSGLDLKLVWEAIRLSVGNSWVWETAAPQVFNASYCPSFSLGLQCKDLQLGYDMAAKFKTPMQLHQSALSIYQQTRYQFGDDAGCYLPPKALEICLQDSLNIPGFDKWDYNNVVTEGSLNVTHTGIDESN